MARMTVNSSHERGATTPIPALPTRKVAGVIAEHRIIPMRISKSSDRLASAIVTVLAWSVCSLVVAVPAAAPDPISSTVVLRIEGAPRTDQAPMQQESDGSVRLKSLTLKPGTSP